MRFFPRQDATSAVAVAEPAPPAVLYGYECPCTTRLESTDERQLLEAAWTHARTCRHDAHAAARAADPTYGHPDHFRYEGP